MKMEATELRIGNFIDIELSDNKQPWIVAVSGVLQDKIYYDPHLDRVDHVEFFIAIKCYWKPIPLTEEWLVKFGLRRNKDEEESDYQRWEQCKGHNIGLYYFYFFINSVGNPVFSLAFGTKTGTFSPNLKGVQYVHQLQNFYYALTGKELVYEPI